MLQYRLANCASNYGLYDTYAYFFADDIDPNTGEVDAKIRVFGDLSDGGVVAAIQAKVSINIIELVALTWYLFDSQLTYLISVNLIVG